MKKAFCVLLIIFCVCPLLAVSAAVESAAAAAVINGDTGEILYAKNKDARLAMASTTKIMTALLLCEAFCDLSQTVTVNAQAVLCEGTSMGLKAGERVTLYDLLCGMMLSSGNDAANAAAYAVSGSIPAFVDRMNKKAAALGLSDTHFATPSGLDGKDHYTTARDLAFMAMYALKNEQIAKVCAAKEITLRYGDPSQKHYLKNHNRLLFMYDDVTGVKTGYTKKAGRCLVSAAKRDGKYVIAVTLNDKNDWADHRKLIDTAYRLLDKGERMTETEVRRVASAYGKETQTQIPGYKYYSASEAPVTCKVNLPAFVYPPVKQGEVLGYAEYYYEYRPVKRVELTADYAVKEEEYGAYETVKELIKLVAAGIIKV